MNRSIFRVSWIILIIILLFVESIISQVQDSIIHTTADTVLVTASRLSTPLSKAVFTLDIVDSAKLSKISNIQSIKEALSNLPSVSINNRFNIAQGDRITIRGIGTRAQFGVRGIKIILDDIPLTFVDGQSQLNNLNISTLDRIEVVRGASSSLYGNSSGGVINAKSRFNFKKKITFVPYFSIGSFGLNRYGLGVSLPVLNGGVSVDGYLTKSNGFREHSDAKYGGINLLTDHQISSTIFINTVINYYDAPYLLNPSSLNKEDAKNNPTKARENIINKGAGKNVKQLQVGIGLKFLLSESTSIKSIFYGINRSLLNSIPSDIIELDKLTGGIRFEFLSNYKLGDTNLMLILGTDYEIQADERKEYENLGVGENAESNPEKMFDNLTYGDLQLDQNEKVNGLGVFGHLEISPFDDLSILFGGRHDQYLFMVDDYLFADDLDNSDELKMDKFSPSSGVAYCYLSDQWVYANYSTSFQTPTTNELSNNPENSGGFNTELKPEEQEGYEIGFRGAYSDNKISYNLVFFNYHISNMLIPYQNSDELTYYKNAGEAKNIGFEALVNWQPIYSVKLVASCSRMNFKYTDLEIINGEATIQLAGNYVPGIPKNNLALSLSYLFPMGFEANFGLNWTDKYFANDFNGPEPNTIDDVNNYVNENYFVTNLGLMYRLDLEWLKLLVNLGLENIFDVRYNDSIVPNAYGNNFFEPASGRAWYLSTTLEF